jgi:hypothetical protein
MSPKGQRSGWPAERISNGSSVTRAVLQLVQVVVKRSLLGMKCLAQDLLKG